MSPSIIGFILIYFSPPQSSARIITSCATSTKRLVKYPESAVLRAVSTRPFLAPYDEMMYSVTDKPSLKFDVIGKSMI